jgi:hypothetical protein
MSIMAALKQAYASGQLGGSYPYSRNTKYVGALAPAGVPTYNTVSALVASLIDNDSVLLGPQGFEEGNLTIPAGTTGINIRGTGGRGASYIEPQATGDEGLNVLGNDVTLINVGIAKGATADYALKIGAAAVNVRRFRAIGCKFEGDGVAVLIHGGADIIFEDCEFAWCGSACLFQGNDEEFPTQVQFRNCYFHNFTTVGLGVQSGGVVKNLRLEDCFFDRQEDGTAPTDFILLSDNANTGYIAGNKFAHATNASSVLTIGTGILWGPNGTEAGWSTARPA